MLLGIGNLFYTQVKDDFLLLRIDIKKLEPEVKWEAPAAVGDKQTDTKLVNRDMPHIYGHLSHTAVDFEYKVVRDDEGKFLSIEGLV